MLQLDLQVIFRQNTLLFFEYLRVRLICKYECETLLHVLNKAACIISCKKILSFLILKSFVMDEFNLNCICVVESELYYLTGLKKISKSVIFMLNCGCVCEF